MNPASTTAAKSEARSSARRLLDTVASLALIVASMTVVWNTFLKNPPEVRRGPAPVVPSEIQSLDGARTKGQTSAKAAIIEYADFQCPFCRDFALNTLPALEKKYIGPGRILLAFRHLPIDRIHPLAMGAAVAAECAGAQDRFWEAHDALFRLKQGLETPVLLEAIAQLGLNRERWQECIAGNDTAQIVSDRAQARRIGVASTPYFLIGRVVAGGVKATHVITGAEPMARFDEVLAEVLGNAHRH